MLAWSASLVQSLDFFGDGQSQLQVHWLVRVFLVTPASCDSAKQALPFHLLALLALVAVMLHAACLAVRHGQSDFLAVHAATSSLIIRARLCLISFSTSASAFSSS